MITYYLKEILKKEGKVSGLLERGLILKKEMITYGQKDNLQ